MATVVQASGNNRKYSVKSLETRVYVGAALLVLFLVLGRLWWLPAHAPLNVNEGWNAGQMQRAFGLGPLYPSPDALIGNNYPPLSFYIVGALGQLIGDHIVAGRILSLLAQIATGGAIWVIVARLAGRRWAAIAGLLFGGFVVTLLRSYVAINDPQWLGHAAMAWALVLIVPSRGDDRPGAARPGAGRIVAAAVLMLAGGLIKHNLVSLPLAATLWLSLFDRRAFVVWIATGTALAAAACLALFVFWGPNVFIDVLAPSRSYSLARMVAKGGPFLIAMLPAILAARPLLGAWRGDGRLLLPVLLTAIAMPIGIVQRAGAGVDVNAFFEGIIAVSIAVPVACALRPARPHAWLAITILPILALVPVATAKNIGELTGRATAIRTWQPFIEQIATTPGPVACDDQAICYWAGRQSAMDFFSVKQRLLKGHGDELLPVLENAHIALIQMREHNPGWQRNLLIPAIRVHYRTTYVADGNELLVPRQR